MKSLALIPCFSLAVAFSLNAQEIPRLTYDFGAGFTQTVGTTGKNLDQGWNVEGGPTYNLMPFLGVKLDLGYNSFGVNSATLSNLGLQNGNFNVFSATVDPIVRLHPRGRIDPYFIGGYGVYHYTQSFTAPSGAALTAFSPFFGGFLANSYSATHGGVNGGAGVELALKGRWKIFAEARYDRIFLEGVQHHIDYVPVSFGFRF
ncbi:MAG TPA: outer membrane beta-barrel protein [Bryobacteraceae bacterium]|nr:outer membrane beta-barrel protein [Bryobacteraceae bacterium]